MKLIKKAFITHQHHDPQACEQNCSLKRGSFLCCKKSISALTAFMLAAVISSCGKVPAPSEIHLNTEDIVFDDIGAVQTIEYTVTPENADTSGIQLICDNPNAASFEGNVLTAVSEGEAYIYAALENSDIQSERVRVEVHDKNAEMLRKAQAVIDKINNIGEVTLESKPAIEEAENAYNAAEDDVKANVTNADILSAARADYDALEQEKLEQERLEQERIEQERLEQERLERERIEREKQAEADSKTVYIGKTGTKYHRADCQTLKGKGRPISLKEAKAQGRTACGVCGG